MNLAVNTEMPKNLLTIDESAYFDVEKKQLKYESDVYGNAENME